MALINRQQGTESQTGQRKPSMTREAKQRTGGLLKNRRLGLINHIEQSISQGLINWVNQYIVHSAAPFNH